MPRRASGHLLPLRGQQTACQASAWRDVCAGCRSDPPVLSATLTIQQLLQNYLTETLSGRDGAAATARWVRPMMIAIER